MVKDRVRDDTVADKEERKRRKKALKKTNARQSNGEDASEDTIKTHAGDKQATSKTDVNNGKAKKIKKVKRRMSETEGEEEKEDLQAEATNGSSETKVHESRKDRYSTFGTVAGAVSRRRALCFVCVESRLTRSTWIMKFSCMPFYQEDQIVVLWIFVVMEKRSAHRTSAALRSWAAWSIGP